MYSTEQPKCGEFPIKMKCKIIPEFSQENSLIGSHFSFRHKNSADAKMTEKQVGELGASQALVCFTTDTPALPSSPVISLDQVNRLTILGLVNTDTVH